MFKSVHLPLGDFPIHGSSEMSRLHQQWETLTPMRMDDEDSVAETQDPAILDDTLDEHAAGVQRRAQAEHYVTAMIAGKFSRTDHEGKLRQAVCLDFARQVRGTLTQALEETDVSVKDGMLRDMVEMARELELEFRVDHTFL